MKNAPTMEEMIKRCEEKQKPHEIIAFAVGAGRVMPLPFADRKTKRAMKDAIKYINGLDGFLGFHPFDDWHTMIVFDELNHAKQGYNLMKSKGIELGQIIPILIPFVYGKGGVAEE